MRSRESFSWHPSLRMPLRDALRGMAAVSNLGGQMPQKTPPILPTFLEEVLRPAVNRFRATTSRILQSNLNQGEIVRAARFVAGASNDKADAYCFVRVAAFGWEHLRSRFQNTRELFSETIASARLMKESTNGLGVSFNAARLLQRLRNSNTIGLPPGLQRHRSSGEQAEVDSNLFAILLWLSVTRSNDPSQELRLLDLASILTRANRSEVIGATDEMHLLAGLFDRLIAQL